MILFQKFGHHGRLGNALFQYASLIGMSKKYNTTLELPQWDYAKYFETPPPMASMHPVIHKKIEEPHYHYCPEFWDKQPWNNTLNVTGWLQSEKYWEHCVDEVRQAFRFAPGFIESAKAKLDALTNPKRQKVAISVRRGDYVDNPNYAQLPILYYLGAFYKFFKPGEVDVVIFTDDFAYCKVHFAAIPNVSFAEFDGITQLAVASLCDHFIIANSTFSWWCAYLGEKEHSEVIRPNYLFNGKLLRQHDSRDFYPERWTTYDHKDKKWPLKNVTFTCPVKFDHNDRLQNAALNLCMLQREFDTNIILMEQGGEKFKHMGQWCKYVKFEGKDFHRTKMLNDMALMSETSIVVNWDADVFLPPAQIIEAVRALETSDMVYPYDGRFARVPRGEFSRLEKILDIGILTDKYRGTLPKDTPSVGGAIFFDKEKFIEGGMENEFMVSYAPEDVERKYRFEKLGLRIARIPGIIYHIDHFCGPDSTNKHANFQANVAELKKEEGMDKAQLQAYVDSWPWVHAYTEGYYETITENAIKSRDAVFETLVKNWPEMSFDSDMVDMVDVGCGLGEWGFEITERWGMNYMGIDHKIPRRKLLIPQDQYMDVDLRNPGMAPSVPTTFDLCLCLEVLEHLPESSARTAVAYLASLSNTILFSAAIKHQGGRNHYNEQMQSYWAELFAEHGLYPYKEDIRQWMKDNENIDLWYRNNMVLYTKKQYPIGYDLDYIHPKFYLNIVRGLKPD